MAPNRRHGSGSDESSSSSAATAGATGDAPAVLEHPENPNEYPQPTRESGGVAPYEPGDDGADFEPSSEHEDAAAD